MVMKPQSSASLCIALTGGIACGKSTVAEIWRREGACILDTDELAHQLIEPGGEYVESVLREFGAHLRTPQGGVDRQQLGAQVFADPAARARLNALLHPPIKARVRAWCESVRQQHRKGVAVIPLLFEAGMDGEWDAVVCVAATLETMRARLTARGLKPAEADARIASQMPIAEKKARATHIIENDGTLAELTAKSLALWKNLVEKGN
jgi:dephospho-CoA kinase